MPKILAEIRKKKRIHKSLSSFQTGVQVRIECYYNSCADVTVGFVTLGLEEEIHPDFVRRGGVGRLRWRANAVAKCFDLGIHLKGSGYIKCPNCQTLFGQVIVISNGRGKKPTVFGYEPDPG